MLLMRHATFPPFGLARRDSAVIAPRLPRISRGWAPAIAANAHLCPLPPVLAWYLLAATGSCASAFLGRSLGPLAAACEAEPECLDPGSRHGFYGVRPRIRLMPRTDSSDFAKNPVAGLSSIISL